MASTKTRLASPAIMENWNYVTCLSSICKWTFRVFLSDLSTPQLKLLSSSEIKENDDVIFQCSYQSYPNSEKIQFFKNGIILKEGVENVLQMHNVSRKDSNTYSCGVKNFVGEKSSKEVHLKIKCKYKYLWKSSDTYRNDFKRLWVDLPSFTWKYKQFPSPSTKKPNNA